MKLHRSLEWGMLVVVSLGFAAATTVAGEAPPATGKKLSAYCM